MANLKDRGIAIGIRSYSWLEYRLGLIKPLTEEAEHLTPSSNASWWYVFGSAAGPPLRGLFQYRHKIEGDALVIHAGDMPTLATQASCGEKPLTQIQPASAETRSSWQA